MENIDKGFDGVAPCLTEETCEIINSFLGSDEENIRLRDKLHIQHQKNKDKIYELNKYLNSLREEYDKVVIEIHLLKTFIDG